jgi:hypothetical protein
MDRSRTRTVKEAKKKGRFQSQVLKKEPLHGGQEGTNIRRRATRRRKGKKKGCLDTESNYGPSDLQSDALPTELSRRV